MSFLVILCFIMAALFALVFFTKRRFGMLGLALAAGAILSAHLVGNLTPIVAKAGFVIVQPPLESIVSAVLVLLPPILLLLSGPTYKNTVQHIFGAAAFAVLAVAFLIEPLGSALVIDGPGRQVFDFFVQYHAAIITAGLLLAIADILLSKTPKHRKSHDKH